MSLSQYMMRPLLLAACRNHVSQLSMMGTLLRRPYSAQEAPQLQQSNAQVEEILTDHDRRLMQFFRCYDLNGDGEITREELFKAMKRAIGYNDQATYEIVEAIYRDCKKDSNETIRFPEFKQGIKIPF